MKAAPPGTGPEWCMWCGEFEPVPPNPIAFCWECGHVWTTWDDWHASARALADQLGEPFDCALIVCPNCPTDLEVTPTGCAEHPEATT